MDPKLAVHERLIFERTGSVRVRLHDSTLPLRIFFERDRTNHVDSDSQGKVSNRWKRLDLISSH
jgi:hypothetical protein